MKYFVIIRGPLGVGKTTIAKKLAEMLKAKYLELDAALEKHGLAKAEGDYTPEEWLKLNEAIIPEIKKEEITVLDGNFYFKEQIDDLVKNLLAKGFIFTLKAPLETCVERDKNRPLSFGPLAAEAVYNLVSKFDYGTTIQVEDKTVDEIIKEIKNFLS
ncbi:MAG: AAA family ATPase [Candidatus Buchananbacteria bacterium]|nr:AAA family ATPase [Candidatus Buchananbacteria bacterium]